jgi:hypothetical protein
MAQALAEWLPPLVPPRRRQELRAGSKVQPYVTEHTSDGDRRRLVLLADRFFLRRFFVFREDLATIQAAAVKRMGWATSRSLIADLCAQTFRRKAYSKYPPFCEGTIFRGSIPGLHVPLSTLRHRHAKPNAAIEWGRLANARRTVASGSCRCRG